LWGISADMFWVNLYEKRGIQKRQRKRKEKERKEVNSRGGGGYLF
jgi:hypothetical protein